MQGAWIEWWSTIPTAGGPDPNPRITKGNHIKLNLHIRKKFNELLPHVITVIQNHLAILKEG
jgi:hypothetical protein